METKTFTSYFQRKTPCYGLLFYENLKKWVKVYIKMNSMAIFLSHRIPANRSFCRRAQFSKDKITLFIVILL